MNPIYKARRRNDVVVRFLCLAAAIFGVTWLALILFTLFYNGLAGISVQIFTENTPPPGANTGDITCPDFSCVNCRSNLPSSRYRNSCEWLVPSACK